MIGALLGNRHSIVEELMFSLDAEGWLHPSIHCRSDNCNERPLNASIDLLVIHNISLPACQFGGDYVQALFTNTLDCSVHPDFAELEGLRVSAHLLIDRAGAVTQFVPFNARAWHAGVSQFEGRDNCNDFSIGIELEGADLIPYTDVQYTQLAAIAQLLQQTYPKIAPSRIVGHSDIAPLRKTDPGPAFDWPRLRQLLAQ